MSEYISKEERKRRERRFDNKLDVKPIWKKMRPDRKVGRPSKYNQGKCLIVLRYFMQGATISEVCAKLLIERDTFYLWRRTYPDFNYTVAIGREFSESWWIQQALLPQANIPMFYPQNFKMFMACTFGWRDSPDATPEAKESEQIVLPRVQENTQLEEVRKLLLGPK